MQKKQIPKMESEKGADNIGEYEDEKIEQIPQRNSISDKAILKKMIKFLIKERKVTL